jgi:hypothetical protein
MRAKRDASLLAPELAAERLEHADEATLEVARRVEPHGMEVLAHEPRSTRSERRCGRACLQHSARPAEVELSALRRCDRGQARLLAPGADDVGREGDVAPMRDVVVAALQEADTFEAVLERDPQE